MPDEPRAKRYFMSYVIREIHSQILAFGSLITTVHPVAKVNGWNEQLTDRAAALLWWVELAFDDDLPEMDVEV
jgi:hypothetical protein